MLVIEERFMIKDMYRKGVSISEIARRMGRDRKTIRQIVTAPALAVAPAPRKPSRVRLIHISPTWRSGWRKGFSMPASSMESW